MNFKISIIFILFITSSCGVKSSPVHPKGTELPAYIDQVLKDTQVEASQKAEDDSKKDSTK